MKHNILKVTRVSVGLLQIDCVHCGQAHFGQLWTEGKSRKATTCWMSGVAIKPGDAVYRPVTNKNNRMNRILVSSIDA